MTQTPTDALRLVPVEPTEAMILAIDAAVHEHWPDARKMAVALWSAALSSAPEKANDAPSEALKTMQFLLAEVEDGVPAICDSPLFASYEFASAFKAVVDYASALAAAPASPLPGGGWHTNFDDAPKDGRWIVTIDKWRNAETMRWSNEVSRLFPEQGERGWVAKGGYSPNTRPELSVAWAEIPAAPTGEPK